MEISVKQYRAMRRGDIALQVTDRALSKREHGRSRFPHREPIGLHPRARVDRTRLEKEGSDPAHPLVQRPPITLVIPERS